MTPTHTHTTKRNTAQIWMRFVVAVAYGAYLGTRNATSPTTLLQAFNLLAFVPVMYARLYLGVDGDAYGMKIVFSGLLNSAALTVLIWITCFTASHETDEMRLRDLLVTAANTAAAAGGGGDDAAAGGDGDNSDPPAVVVEEESEF